MSTVPARPADAPGALAAIPDARVVAVDVREDLRQGREPFQRIMEARARVPDGGALCLRAIFEPFPLYGVLGRQGFAHHTECLADDDWRVWFYPEGAPAPSTSAPQAAPAEGTADDDTGVVVLDVRGLEPPEPMVRTLEALNDLPPDGTLVQLNVRVPRFLLPELEARGFTYEIREQEPELVRVFIRRAP